VYKVTPKNPTPETIKAAKLAEKLLNESLGEFCSVCFLPALKRLGASKARCLKCGFQVSCCDWE
jgi:hypothetical protein